MAPRTMLDPMDDIARQAHQGSVSAIIQTLNEKLADAGVRTRAILADGVLQLLCEAETKEGLKQSVLVGQIRQILEGIAPRNIRRVKINSRIVKEQQLLWLEEISRDPENQLLWSETIILTKPNIFKRLTQSLKQPATVPSKKPPLPKKLAPRNIRGKNSFWRGTMNGIGISLLLILIGWLLNSWWGSKINVQLSNQAQNSQAESSPKQRTALRSDAFAEAVRLAEQASIAGQNVQTAAQWLDVAAKWERASDLMSQVKPEDRRYKTAQNRMKFYRQNSEAAQKQARNMRS
jgi:hypothetical protein